MHTVVLIVCLSLMCLAAHAGVPIAAGGKARCVIVSQPGATVAERHAAEELAATLRQVTGAEFRIVAASPRSGGVIIVGPGPAADALLRTPQRPENRSSPADRRAKHQGQELATHPLTHSPHHLITASYERLIMRTSGRCLLLTGGRPRGTLYAVCRFLQEQCGVRWWTPWASTIPRRPDLTVPDLAVEERPAFESRDPFWYPAFNPDWAVRNGSNSQNAHLDEARGGAVTYQGFVHTFYPLVPPETYSSVHPEWYALVHGKRTFTNAQLCTTNPQLRDFLVDRIRERIRANPGASIVSLSQNDCFNPCECENCKAIDDAEGSHAGSMIALVNYVAERIGKEYPNVAIDTLAYQYTRKAPKTIKPLPNVIVRLCSIECNFAAPLDDPSNKSFADDIRDWNRLTNRLYIWDYTTNFANYVQPHPNWFVLGPNLRFFHDHGAKGVFEQGAYQSSGSEMSEMRAWMLARLLWNPYQDDRKLIREFLDGYYGAAAQPIWDYLELVSDKAKGVNMGCYAPPSSPYLDFGTMGRAEKLWQEAEAAVASQPDLLWRVRQGHLPVRYVFLARWPQLRRDCLRSGATWPLPASRKVVADAWLADATGPGPAGWTPMTHLSEGGLTPRAFVARFAVDPPDPTPLPARRASSDRPAGIAGANAATCVDVQDDKATLYREGELAEIAADPTASDGLAARMPGSHHEWAVQSPLAKLPERVRSGKWRVYAIVRVEKVGGAGSGTAFTAGVYDTAASASRGEIEQPLTSTEDGYLPYLLGTVSTNHDQYVWVAPAANPGVKAVWVDRIYFVPAP